MSQNLEHVTFRPGVLAGRLNGGRLTPGATAKRDLMRYYATIGLRFASWERSIDPTQDVWEVIATFVETRDWDIVPSAKNFRADFESFLRSPMARRFEPTDRNRALAALRGADEVDILAIIDRAEQDAVPRDTPGATSPDDATADATSAAS